MLDHADNEHINEEDRNMINWVNVGVIAITYLATLVAIWIINLKELKDECSKVTIGDVVKEFEFWEFIPLYNTFVLLCVVIVYFVWEKCRIGMLCKLVCDKIKNIEL